MLFIVFTQSQTYNDVAVIMNSNNDASIEIGEYFALQRNIPARNLIYVDAEINELIDTTEFFNILHQIKNHFINYELVDSINYIVTTKGIPHNVRTGDSCTGVTGALKCSSFDSELTLMFSKKEDEMFHGGLIGNTYYNSHLNFNRTDFGIYLVTRLDAYSTEQVFSIIDKSGPNQLINKESARIVFDISHCDTSLIGLFSAYYQYAIDFLNQNNWIVIFNDDSSMLTNEQNVLGYASANYGLGKKLPEFDWFNGSFAFQVAPAGEISFFDSLSASFLNLPDFIEDGATSGSGYANVIYFSQSPRLENFYSHYLQDTSEIKFNLAESYYSSIGELSKNYILIGDPKTTILITHTGIDDPRYDISNLILSPNPATDYINARMNSKKSKSVSVTIVNINGQMVINQEHHLNQGINNISIDIQNLPKGIYGIIVDDKDGYKVSDRIVKI